MMNRKIHYLLVGILLTVSARAEDIQVKSYLDRTSVGLNQQFSLMVEISGSEAQSADASPPSLDQFAVFLGSSSSQNMQWINGKTSFSRILTFQYQAVKSGMFSIGPIQVKAGGKTYSTDPLQITVSPSSQPPVTQQARPPGPGADAGQIGDTDLFLSVSASKEKVFVNEPVIVTYTIYTRVNVSSFEIMDQPQTTGFWVEEYPLGRSPRTYSQVINGKRYTAAVIRKMAIFPMSAGKKRLDPLQLNCNVRVRSRSNDIFDDFFNNDMFGRTVSKRVQSKALSVQVIELPQEGRPAGFSGVVGRLQLSTELVKTDLSTNEAVTYRIKVEGEGNLKTLPKPEVSFPADFEVYPQDDKLTVERGESSISGSKIFEWVLVPRAAGNRKIEPVSLSVFDPVSASYKILRGRGYDLRVKKGTDSETARPSGLSKEEVQLLGQDIRFIKTEDSDFFPIDRPPLTGLFFWIVLLFPLPLLSGAFLYRRHRDRLASDLAYARKRRAGRAARKQLARARNCLSGGNEKEFYTEVSRALMGFLADKLNLPEAGLVRDEIRSHLRKRNVTQETISAVIDCLDTCDRQRFAPASADMEQMKKFLHNCGRILSRLDREIT